MRIVLKASIFVFCLAQVPGINDALIFQMIFSLLSQKLDGEIVNTKKSYEKLEKDWTKMKLGEYLVEHPMFD